MNLLSVNVGLPREVVTDTRLVLTSIFKSAVSGRIPIRNHSEMAAIWTDRDDLDVNIVPRRREACS